VQSHSGRSGAGGISLFLVKVYTLVNLVQTMSKVNLLSRRARSLVAAGNRLGHTDYHGSRGATPRGQGAAVHEMGLALSIYRDLPDGGSRTRAGPAGVGAGGDRRAGRGGARPPPLRLGAVISGGDDHGARLDIDWRPARQRCRSVVLTSPATRVPGCRSARTAARRCWWREATSWTCSSSRSCL